MNDFTKEELKDLLSCVKSNKAYHINHMEIIYPILMNKIQSLIDNYCEHPSILKHEPLKQCQCCLKVWRF